MMSNKMEKELKAISDHVDILGQYLFTLAEESRLAKVEFDVLAVRFNEYRKTDRKSVV